MQRGNLFARDRGYKSKQKGTKEMEKKSEKKTEKQIVVVEDVVFTGEQARVVQFLLERLQHAEYNRFYGEQKIREATQKIHEINKSIPRI